MSNFKDISALCIEQVKALMVERLPEADRKPASLFAGTYLERRQPKELTAMSTSHLCGEVSSIWRFIKYRMPGKTSVRVYNPSPEEHHWHSTHSIIEIVCDDQPFLVTSILMELERQDIQVHSLNHVIYDACRDSQGSLVSAERVNGNADKPLEFFMHLEVDRQMDENAFSEMELSIWKVLGDVFKTCRDWVPMREKMQEIIHHCRNQGITSQPVPVEECQESLDFLEWLIPDRFVFIGYAYYALKEYDEGFSLAYEHGSGLGLLDESSMVNRKLVTPLSSRQLMHFRKNELLVLTKSDLVSTIHRPGHLDHIGIRHYRDGKVVGEWRFCGLLSSAAYIEPVSRMPLARKKVKAIMDSHASVEAHRSRILEFVLNQYPRDELLQSNLPYLKKMLQVVVSKQERRQLGVFLRVDSCDQFVSVMIYIQKESYSTEVRQQFEQILMEMFDGHSTDFNIVTTDHPLTQVLLRVYCQNASEHEVDVESLEDRLRDLTMRWEDRLQNSMVVRFGEGEGKRLYRKYCRAFPAAYREDCHPLQSVMDIEAFENLGADSAVDTRLYYPVDSETELHFRVLGRGQTLILSDVLPIIERMGVRVISARPYKVKAKDGSRCWVIDFVIVTENNRSLEDKLSREKFQEVFVNTWSGRMENDGFNALVINGEIAWRNIVLLRAMSRYLLQLRIPFSQRYMEETCNRNPEIATGIVELFYLRFDPEFSGDREKEYALQIEKIDRQLESVASLDEERILCQFVALIKALTRTSFFQKDERGQRKPCLSFKLSPRMLSFVPEPRPQYEIFVYSPRVEGVHMRAGKIARGGLRWSDRKEDFRTEVLGLVKAQMVKNSVIVPMGAKGGFVARQLPVNGSREDVMKEGIACYQMFISGILDITDNMVEGKIVPPVDVVRHDEDDPYLVVAADKGTASFSDIANTISKKYGFWLGDAFASGGSQGYDHKAMGITAKGAWESVKRLFWSKGMDIQREPFTVAGIGDMAGDVFGNGMLLSPHIRLVAAFNHQHIFIDPDPDTEKSFIERQRLFQMKRSTWDDYDRKLVSHGGGVFSRSLKSIRITPEIKSVLGIQENVLTPAELIRAILCAPLDLLWNGGIGTYVKSSTQTHEEVGDFSNDGLRIDATQLRVSVIGEGGNLGLTQQARIEFAKNGGLINTDAVDNSAGVDCSDHEVNIKILLDQIVSDGEMTEKQRNLLLESMTDEVSSLVLRNNYLQTQGLTLTVREKNRLVGDHRRQIAQLEKEDRLDRKLENLPSDEDMLLLQKSGSGLTRPEASVVLAHVKLKLFDELVEAGIDREADLARRFSEYFPQAIEERFPGRIQNHPLKKEILATHIINEVCNRMGACFIHRIQQQSRCDSIAVIRVFMAVCDIFGLRQLWDRIESEQYSIDPARVCDMLCKIRRHVEKCVLWLLSQHGADINADRMVGRYGENIGILEKSLPDYLNPSDREKWQQACDALMEAGLSGDCVRSYASLDFLYHGLCISDIAKDQGRNVVDTAFTYYALEDRLTLHWLREQLRLLPDADLWQRKARSSLRDRLDGTLGNHCRRILEENEESAGDAVDQWMNQKGEHMSRWQKTIMDIQSLDAPELAVFSVAVKELARLAEV